MNNTINNSREEYMDIAKALGIILVVMGHAQSVGHNMIYLFHMPLFFFISGYFYKDIYSEKPNLLIKKRFKNLYIPFIKYEILFLIFHNLFVKFKFYTNFEGRIFDMNTLKDFFVSLTKILTFNGTELLVIPLWFLPSLFLTTVLFCFISAICIEESEVIRAGVILLLGIIGIKIPIIIDQYIFCRQVINTALVALIFYYLGYLYSRFREKIKLNVIVAIAAFIFLLISRKYFNVFLDIRNMFFNPILLIPDSLCGIYVVIYISKIVSNININLRGLNYIGRNTIPILAWHMLIFKIIDIIQIKMYKIPIERLGELAPINSSGIWWIIFSIAGVLIPTSICYVIYDSGKLLKK